MYSQLSQQNSFYSSSFEPYQGLGQLSPVNLQTMVQQQNLEYLQHLCLYTQKLRLNPLWYDEEEAQNKLKVLQIFQLGINYSNNFKKMSDRTTFSKTEKIQRLKNQKIDKIKKIRQHKEQVTKKKVEFKKLKHRIYKEMYGKLKQQLDHEQYKYHEKDESSYCQRDQNSNKTSSRHGYPPMYDIHYYVPGVQEAGNFINPPPPIQYQQSSRNQPQRTPPQNYYQPYQPQPQPQQNNNRSNYVQKPFGNNHHQKKNQVNNPPIGPKGQNMFIQVHQENGKNLSPSEYFNDDNQSQKSHIIKSGVNNVLEDQKGKYEIGQNQMQESQTKKIDLNKQINKDDYQQIPQLGVKSRINSKPSRITKNTKNQSQQISNKSSDSMMGFPSKLPINDSKDKSKISSQDNDFYGFDLKEKSIDKKEKSQNPQIVVDKSNKVMKHTKSQLKEQDQQQSQKKKNVSLNMENDESDSIPFSINNLKSKVQQRRGSTQKQSDSAILNSMTKINLPVGDSRITRNVKQTANVILNQNIAKNENSIETQKPSEKPSKSFFRRNSTIEQKDQPKQQIKQQKNRKSSDDDLDLGIDLLANSSYPNKEKQRGKNLLSVSKKPEDVNSSSVDIKTEQTIKSDIADSGIQMKFDQSKHHGKFSNHPSDANQQQEKEGKGIQILKAPPARNSKQTLTKSKMTQSQAKQMRNSHQEQKQSVLKKDLGLLVSNTGKNENQNNGHKMLNNLDFKQNTKIQEQSQSNNSRPPQLAKQQSQNEEEQYEQDFEFDEDALRESIPIQKRNSNIEVQRQLGNKKYAQILEDQFIPKGKQLKIKGSIVESEDIDQLFELAQIPQNSTIAKRPALKFSSSNQFSKMLSKRIPNKASQNEKSKQLDKQINSESIMGSNKGGSSFQINVINTDGETKNIKPKKTYTSIKEIKQEVEERQQLEGSAKQMYILQNIIQSKKIPSKIQEQEKLKNVKHQESVTMQITESKNLKIVGEQKPNNQVRFSSLSMNKSENYDQDFEQLEDLIEDSNMLPGQKMDDQQKMQKIINNVKNKKDLSKKKFKPLNQDFIKRQIQSKFQEKYESIHTAEQWIKIKQFYIQQKKNLLEQKVNEVESSKEEKKRKDIFEEDDLNYSQSQLQSNLSKFNSNTKKEIKPIEAITEEKMPQAENSRFLLKQNVKQKQSQRNKILTNIEEGRNKYDIEDELTRVVNEDARNLINGKEQQSFDQI